MSVSAALPSIKYALFSYYLVVTGCRSVISNKYVNSIHNKYYNVSSLNADSRNLSTRQRPEEPPWRILYFGTDNFSLACLQPLNAKLNTGTLLSGLGVVSSPGSTVYKFAESERLPIYTWPPDDSVLNNYDLGIVVSYGKLIPANIINNLPFGILNVHGSLLPRWRGAAPIAYAIMHGDAETGVSIMRIKPDKFDVGDIVRQYRCSIGPKETTPELTKRLANHAGLLLMECIRDIPRCIDMATPQPKEGVTYAPKISAKLSPVDWKNMSAENIYNLYRAISYKYPLTTKWYGKGIRLSNISLEYESLAERKQGQNLSSKKSALNFLNSNDSTLNQEKKFDINKNIIASPGKIKYNHNNHIIKVQCADGKWVICENFKTSNSRNMSSHDFYNGYLSKKDKKDWFFE